MKYINSIRETIGNTPLLKLNRIGGEGNANIFVKLEYLNPSGSFKDRMASAMLDAAEKGETWNHRRLSPGGTVVEASAGNCAPAVALQCAVRGYKSKLFLYRYNFENGIDARLKITEAFGPEVKMSSEPDKYLDKETCEKFFKEDKDLPHVIAAKVDCQLEEDNNDNCVWLDQIFNDANYIGQETMGHEIYDQLDGKIDAIGCSVGSGATLYGLGRALTQRGFRPELYFGVVPGGSEQYMVLEKPISERGEFSPADIRFRIADSMGLKKWTSEKSIIDKMIQDGYPDKFYLVSDSEARDMANRLCKEEGIYCGMSSGANVAVALKLAKELGSGKNIVTIIADRRDRYLNEYPKDKYVV